MISPILPLIESAINHLIENDPLTKQKISLLKDKVFAVQITDLDLTLFIHMQQHGVSLHANWPTQAHTTISGTLIGLMNTASKQASTETLFNHSVTIQGDLRSGEHMRSILNHIDIDWEHLLAQRIGHTASGHAVQTFTHAKQFMKTTRTKLHRQLYDYLHKESSFAVSPHDLNNFKQSIRTLRQATEHLEIKVEQLKQKKV